MRWKRGQRLKLVSETEAPTRARGILREVREGLGVPAVPKLYEAYAAFPDFLEIHWDAFRPAIQSRQFFFIGARLAAESYTRAHNYFEVRAISRREASSQVATALSISQVLDYYQYLDPLLLLIAAAQMQAFEGPIGQPLRSEPATHVEFAAAPPTLCDGNASAELQRSWCERKRLLELAFVSDEHRALACWPEFYVEYWAALKELLQSPVYADCQYRLADSALNMAGELPVRIDTGVPQLQDAGLNNEQITSVMRITEAFMQALTGLVLDITFARIGVEKDAEHGPPKQPATRSVQKREKTGSPVRAA